MQLKNSTPKLGGKEEDIDNMGYYVDLPYCVEELVRGRRHILTIWDIGISINNIY